LDKCAGDRHTIGSPCPGVGQLEDCRFTSTDGRILHPVDPQFDISVGTDHNYGFGHSCEIVASYRRRSKKTDGFLREVNTSNKPVFWSDSLTAKLHAIRSRSSLPIGRSTTHHPENPAREPLQRLSPLPPSSPSHITVRHFQPYSRADSGAAS